MTEHVYDDLRLTTRTRRFAFYCTCGAAMTGSVSPLRNADELERIFRSLHTGAGHEPTDQRTASNARRRAEAHP